MVNGDNPIISTLVLPSFFSDQDILNLEENNFRLAFTIENTLDRERRDDPRYVKWSARFYGTKNGEGFLEYLDFHKCTEEDYAEFNPIDPKS